MHRRALVHTILHYQLSTPLPQTRWGGTQTGLISAPLTVTYLPLILISRSNSKLPTSIGPAWRTTRTSFTDLEIRARRQLPLGYRQTGQKPFPRRLHHQKCVQRLGSQRISREGHLFQPRFDRLATRTTTWKRNTGRGSSLTSKDCFRYFRNRCQKVSIGAKTGQSRILIALVEGRFWMLRDGELLCWKKRTKDWRPRWNS